MRGCFVTGTDTGVGKTVLAAAIAARLVTDGVSVVVRKPVLSGLDELSDGGWPFDDELLALGAGCDPDRVALRRFGPAVSPHLAAELAGEEIDVGSLVAELRESFTGGVPVVEGVGGLLVPLSVGWDVRRLAAELGLPVVLAARPGLGTINHTLLTVGAARAVGLQLAGIVFTPWPAQPSVIERSNLETVARLSGIEVATLPVIKRPEQALLASAAVELPLERWLV
jgi:dethiobiotin synthetase